MLENELMDLTEQELQDIVNKLQREIEIIKLNNLKKEIIIEELS